MVSPERGMETRGKCWNGGEPIATLYKIWRPRIWTTDLPPLGEAYQKNVVLN